jgi:hypothetical protein
MIFDGTDRVVGGNAGSMYPTYRREFDDLRAVPSPLALVLTGSYDAAARAGSVTVHVLNGTGATISGTLHVVVTETNISYHWQSQDWLYDVARDMIPGAQGQPVVLRPHATLEATQPFVLGGTWDDRNCTVVAFVQDQTTDEVYQAAKWYVNPDVRIALTPDTSPVLVPANGGEVGYTISLTNTTSSGRTVDLWSLAYLPNGLPRTVLRRTTVALPGGGSWTHHYAQVVPGSAPAGQYLYVAKTGRYPARTMDWGAFFLTKEPGVDEGEAPRVCPIE